MNILAVDPNSKFIAYVVMDETKRIIEKGTKKIDGLTSELDKLVSKYKIMGIAVEGFVYYSNIRINKYGIATIELIGRLFQYCIHKGLMFWKYSKPDINRGLSGSSRTKEGRMQEIIKWLLKLEKNITPEHINAAACVGVYTFDMLQYQKTVKKNGE